MKRSYWIGIVLVVFIIALAITACQSQGAAPAKEATPAKAAEPAKQAEPAKAAAPAKQAIELTFNAQFPETHFWSRADKAWGDRIEKESGGRVKMKYFWGSALYAPPNWYAEIAKGTADIGSEGWSSYQPSGFDLNRAVLFHFYDVADWRMGVRVYNEVASEFPQLRAEMANVKTLAMRGPYGSTQIMTKKRVASLKDLSGLRIRTIADWLEQLKEVGAEPVAMPAGEVYTSLEKGIVQGTIFPYETLKSFKLAEVTKYVAELNMGAFPGPTIHMNLNTWNKLPPDIQKVFNDIGSDVYNEAAQKAMDESDQDGIAFAKQQGVEFNKLSQEDLAKWNSLSAAAGAKQAAAADAKGLPASKAVAKVRALIEQYKKK